MSHLPSRASIELPGCKSASARALVLAACGHGTRALKGLSDCEDTHFLKSALETWGAKFHAEEGTLMVEGWGGCPPSGPVFLNAGEAATNLRFLLALSGICDGEITLTGSPALMMRPHEPLLEFLRDNGCKVSWVKNGAAPCLKVCGGALPSGEWKGPGELSSQFLSGLALAAHARGGVSLLLPDKIASSGYFQMTEDILKSFPSQAVDEGAEFEVPADASAATFFLVLLAIRRSRLFFTRAWSQEHPEAQVARWLLDSQILQKKGKEFSATSEYPNTELEVNLDPFPDAGPALAVLASHLPHGLSFTGLQRLRIKESDRIDGMVRLANAVGAQALLEGDNLLRISPHSAGPKPGGVFDSSGDHRLAMAGAIAGLEVSQPDCVAKSFPGFWSELRRFTES